MIIDYIPIILVIIVAAAFAGIVVLSSVIFGPKRPNKIKVMPYESGKDPIGTTHERISIKYYLVAILFIIFDIEVIYVYPWAVQFKSLFNDFGIFAFLPMFIFLIVLELGFLYILMKGGLKWD
ncbi:NADH-quinone oxidoreductase subunit A [Stygiobacter electus]|uniref:NADH-quinone oxidoreductase subunit A n=1 Tax=Stygiobacter electus TaxID=3032292 RepID=A0AAE3TC28_9BACT|nr:NADH-quinone oxidoreductase subunit A [Stygiobacter electus]MDF1611056.1 NADH-quinone oxidoreductase subunit A [Stygiobacter electus]